MVRDVLAPMFSNGQAALMDIKYIAFGNVRNKSDGSYAYQHGDGGRRRCARTSSCPLKCPEQQDFVLACCMTAMPLASPPFWGQRLQAAA